MPAGRPRTSTPPKKDVIKLGKHLVKWASEESKELRSRFCEWYTLDDIGLIRTQWENLLKLPEFRIYYEKARALLGRRYMDGTINPSIAHRLMWHYVYESAEQEKSKMQFESDLKKSEALAVSEEYKELTQTLLQQLKAMQDQAKEIQDLKNELNRYKRESKS